MNSYLSHMPTTIVGMAPVFRFTTTLFRGETVMKCPTCSDTLVRVKYEGFPVFRCESCFGYLVPVHRIDSFKRSRGKTIEQLKDETLGESRPDTEERIRCPRCKMVMKKEFFKDLASFHTDTCESCELIWFDGGELARLQLCYEMSPQGQDAAEFQRRLREMSPEAKAEFERNLANLPERESAVSGALRESLLRGRFRFPGFFDID